MALVLPGFARSANPQTQPYKITSLKAMLFFEDKGTFSPDAADDDAGPPYAPPRFWNTPMQYENRSTSIFVVVEVSGDGRRTPLPKLEMTARYIPNGLATKPIVIRKIVSVEIPIKVREYDKYYAGFWLDRTGCNPVKLSARLIGRHESSSIKKVIKFDCGE
jgi:hypothetical protein